jgi:hypothetical protein
MRQLGFTIILALTLAGCSSREDQDSKKEAISIDKAQINIAKMNQFFQDTAASTNWHCFLLNKPEPDDEAERFKRLKTMSGRPVRITAGRDVLATGQISGILTSQDRYEGLSITFQSPEARQELEAKLGIQRQPMPPK